MAKHIQSVAESSIPTVAKAKFWQELRSGDLVFCEGMGRIIDTGIKVETGSCFTHVMSIWLDGTVWTTIEATIDRGVHCGTFEEYVEGYVGNLVLARRPAIGDTDLRSARNTMLSLLDSAYDWQQEARIVAHGLLPFFPVKATHKEYYCSGLQYVGSLGTDHPLQECKTHGEMPTPEDNWTDPTVTPICALVR